MRQRLFSVIFLGTGFLFPALVAAESSETASKDTIAAAAQPNTSGVPTGDLHLFTHFAAIPAGADLSTIRFVKAKRVRVPTKIRYTTVAGYCKEAGCGDPDGSGAYSYGRTGDPVEAYELTYSYMGEPLASDEYGGRNFTFSVYFQVSEVSPDAQKALSQKKLSRADAEGFFVLSTRRETATRIAIDEKQSTFCAGNYVDGVWAHADAGCMDTVSYTPVTAASDYLTVRVDNASPQIAASK